MNARCLINTMGLVAYELACAETHERAAAKHRREAMRMQASVHAEFKTALAEAQTRPKTQPQKLAPR